MTIHTEQQNEMSIRAPLDEYFIRLNMLHGLGFHLGVQLNWFSEDVRHRIERGEITTEHLFAGTSLPIRDLTEWPSHGWAVCYASGGFDTSGDEFLALASDLVQREGAWTISQAFEAFETFVMDTLAAAHLQFPNLVDQKELSRKEPELLKARLAPTDLNYWKQFVRSTYRNAESALKAIRRVTPHLEEAELQNNRVLNLQDWLRAVTEVRHAVVHSNQLVRNRRLTPLSNSERNMLYASFGGVQRTDGYALGVSQKQVDTAMTTFAEYGYALYKSICIHTGKDWKIFQNQGTQ